MSTQYVNRYGDVITAWPASTEHEYTIEDFGWLCPEGHSDCADTEDGPCTAGHWDEEASEAALRQVFGDDEVDLGLDGPILPPANRRPTPLSPLPHEQH